MINEALNKFDAKTPEVLRITNNRGTLTVSGSFLGHGGVAIYSIDRDDQVGNVFFLNRDEVDQVIGQLNYLKGITE